MISGWWLLPPLFLWGMHATWQRRQLRRLEHGMWQLRSAHEHLEQRFRRRSDRLDALFASVNEAILRLDIQGNVVALNERARRVFSLPRNMHPPQPMTALYRRPQWNKAVKKALKQLPEPARLPDIHLQDCVLAARLAPLENGQALLLCLDVSRQRELEAQREQLVRDLMHDLKTPLTSILGYARTIEQLGDDKSVRRESAGIIAREARRLNHLLESMLTLDQAGTRQPETGVHCDIREVVKEMTYLMKPAAKAAGVRFETEVTPEIRAFPMDSGDLHRLMTNLVDNAIRYSPENGRVCLGVSRRGDHIELHVTDEGPGIAPRHLPHVTERFYRADDSRSKGGGGHGVGLAIVAETVARYGGELTLANRSKGGLVVRVRIPVREGRASPA